MGFVPAGDREEGVLGFAPAGRDVYSNEHPRKGPRSFRSETIAASGKGDFAPNGAQQIKRDRQAINICVAQSASGPHSRVGPHSHVGGSGTV